MEMEWFPGERIATAELAMKMQDEIFRLKAKVRRLETELLRQGGFKKRFTEFAKGYLSNYYNSYDSAQEIAEKGLPPTGHFTGNSLESRGIGREDWRNVARAYWNLRDKREQNKEIE